MKIRSIRKVQASGRAANGVGVAAIAAVSLVTSGCGAGLYMGQHPTSEYRKIDSHMSEELRSSLQTVAVQASTARPDLVVAGDYGEAVPTAGEGAATGAGAGASATGEMIAEDPRAILIAPIILPAAMIVGAIFGASAAKIEQQVREFRDKLTDDLAEENTRTLPSDELAQNLHSYLMNSPDFDTALVTADEPVPTDADAVLEIRVTELMITVTGNDAIMKTTAVVDLRRAEDDTIIYNRVYSFREKDTLRNWAEDDNALWNDYLDNAQHHFTRQISSDFFDGIVLRHVLRPTKSATGTGRDDWSKTVKTRTPEFTWELFLLGGDAYGSWADNIDTSDVTYELEVYDEGRRVYLADNITTLSHRVETPLDSCKTYTWSVRPHYQVNGKTRVGEWMSNLSTFDRIFRSPTSSTEPETPDFWQGYAEIKIGCRSS